MIQLQKRCLKPDDKKYVQLFPVEKNDHKKSVPIRGKWLEKVKDYDYRSDVYTLRVPTLICTGRKDPQTPLIMNEELNDRIMDSQLEVFEKSGHFPFIEEEEKFIQVVGDFLSRDQSIDKNKFDPDCPCPKECRRRCKCVECYDYHGAKGTLPYCKRKKRKNKRTNSR